MYTCLVFLFSDIDNLILDTSLECDIRNHHATAEDKIDDNFRYHTTNE